MADEIDTQDDDVLELTDELEPEGEAHEPVEGEGEREGEQGDGDEREDFAIEIDGEEAAPEETPLMRQLREQLRDTQRELSGYRKVTPAKIEVGPEPTLEDPDVDYDPDKFKTKWLEWNGTKQAAANAEREAEQAEQVKNQEFVRRHTAYRAKAMQLPVKDFDAAEATVIGALPELLQSAVVAYANDPAKVVYALAKHPAKLAALSQETDPIKFVLAINELERNLKVVNRKAPPAPEASTIQRGSAPLAKTADKQADKLLEKAERTGNMTEYNRYMRAKKAA